MPLVDSGPRSSFKYPVPALHPFDMGRVRHMIEQHWKLNRTAVNQDTDRLAAFLSTSLQADVLEARPGESCLTWQVPLHWRVRKGQLRSRSGDVIADYADNPLHLWTHSVSYSGTVDRDTLLSQHISSDPRRPDEFPYHYRNGYRYGAREWGFSIPFRRVEQMTDDAYEVEIEADLDENGTAKVVDASLEGQLSDTVFFLAHTCHPAQVADGLGCIAIASELHRWLGRRGQRRYSYRFIFGPEYFGGAVYLDRAPAERVSALRFGAYLDMLTTHQPLGFQGSRQGDSLLDRVARNVLKSHLPTSFERPFRKLWGNDEVLYDGPGFAIPTIGIGRAMHREYHYNSDDLDHYCDYTALESLWILSRIVEVLETDYVPLRGYRGPVYRSRYNLNAELARTSEQSDAVDQVQMLMDGERSWFDIADALNLDAFAVREFCDELVEVGLAERCARKPRVADLGSHARDMHPPGNGA